MNKIALSIGIILIATMLAGCAGNSGQQQALGAPGAPAECGKDYACLDKNFEVCAPAEFSTPFVGGTTYTITVLGADGDKCHWTTTTAFDSKDCLYPLTEMSNRAFGHLFGTDKTGTDCSSANCMNQEELQQTYCTSTPAQQE